MGKQRSKLQAAAAASRSANDKPKPVALPVPAKLDKKLDAIEFWQWLAAAGLKAEDTFQAIVLCETWQQYRAMLGTVEDLGSEFFHTLHNEDGAVIGTRPHAAIGTLDAARSSLLKQLKQFPISPAARAAIAGRISGENPEQPTKPEARDRNA